MPLEPDYLVRPYIVRGSLTELVGKVKESGKTTFLLRLARAVINGDSFLGEPCKQSPVVFLTEQPESSFRHMLGAAGLSECDDLHVQYWHQVFADPWKDVIDRAIQKSRDARAELLAIDTVFKFAAVDDENDSAEVDRATNPLKLAASGGIAVICSRHERKSGGNAVDAGRGASAFTGQMDMVLHLKRPEGNRRSNVRSLVSIGRFPSSESVFMELTPGGYVNHGQERDFARREVRQAIKDNLPRTEGDALTRDDLYKLMPEGSGTTVFDSELKALVDRAEIERNGAGARGNPFRYWLPERISIHSPATHSL